MSELRAVLDAAAAAGEPAVLATVVRVSGSAYRRPGARLLLCRDGRRVGDGDLEVGAGGEQPQVPLGVRMGERVDADLHQCCSNGSRRVRRSATVTAPPVSRDWFAASPRATAARSTGV